ncbi:MAG TPA: YceI family protein [Rhizomicrobium sp.]|jgi:polyisoprenoid-binding protein YceI
MRICAIAAALCATLVCGAASAQVSLNPKNASPGVYRLEPRHTQVMFAIRHLDLTEFYGRFDKMSGTLSFDSRHPEASTVSIALDLSSVDTPNTDLNGEIKNVFNAAKYPTATFKSTSVSVTSPTTGKITGDLTLNGVTKPLVLDVTFNGSREDPMDGAAALGFTATATVHRADFKLDQMIWSGAVGADVTLTINALFEQKRLY